MSRIQIYTTRWCGYCVRAKALLDEKGIRYDEVSLDDDPGFATAEEAAMHFVDEPVDER